MYILLETQTNETMSIVPPVAYEDRNQAESAFHSALSAAAVSSVRVHAVTLLDEHGNTIKREFYEHGQE